MRKWNNKPIRNTKEYREQVGHSTRLLRSLKTVSQDFLNMRFERPSRTLHNYLCLAQPQGLYEFSTP
jgi:hypothetical protein